MLASENRAISNLKVIARSKTMKSTAETSNVWKHYGHLFTTEDELLDDTQWYCMKCVDAEKAKRDEGHLSKIHKVGNGTATGNMKQHLLKSHSIDTDTIQATQKQRQLLEQWCSLDKKKSMASFDINREILLWFCQDLLPFNLVEHEGMTRFFEKNFDLKLPGRSTLSGACLVDMYKAMKGVVKDQLQDYGFLTVMFDGWTDRYQRLPFMGIRASAITTDWNARIYTLSVVPIEDHTSKRIRDHVKDVVTSFSNKRFGEINLHTVHDGAQNMFATSRLLNVTDPQHCTAHVLHLLLTKDGFEGCPEISGVLEKVKDIVNTLHYKSYALSQEMLYREDIETYKELKRLAQVHDMLSLDDRFGVSSDDDSAHGADDGTVAQYNHRTLKTMIPTRWNSSLNMLESYCCLHEPASNMLKSIGKSDLVIDEDDFHLIKSLKDFLVTFRELTEIVSDATNSLGVIPLIKAKIDEICTVEDEDPNELKKLKRKIATKVDSRFKISETAKLASTLNPAIRDVLFSREEAKEILAKNQPNVASDEIASEEPREPKSKLLKLMKSMKSTATHTDNDYSHEIDRYLSHQPTIDEQENGLLFWKRNEKMYPSLARLAKEYLAIPSSSVPVENMFSTTGLVMNAKRSSLDALNMNMISFIHDNIKYCSNL